MNEPSAAPARPDGEESVWEGLAALAVVVAGLAWFPACLAIWFASRIAASDVALAAENGFLLVVALQVPVVSIASALDREDARRWRAALAAGVGAGVAAALTSVLVELATIRDGATLHTYLYFGLLAGLMTVTCGGLLWWFTSTFSVRVASATCLAASVVLAAVSTYCVSSAHIETALPLSARSRFQLASDGQDYSHLRMDASPVSLAQARRYADTLGLEVVTEGEATGTWRRDDTRAQQDTRRYPTGRSGCVTTVTLDQDALVFIEDCDWGI